MSSNRTAPTMPRVRTAGRLLSDRVDAGELLDESGQDPEELAANLRDIRTVNRLAGGSATVLHHLPALVRDVPADRPVTILDLATGSGDIPRAVAAWAARHGREVAITASDASPEVLAEARRLLKDMAGVTFALLDGRDVPLPDGTFDIVLCSLALHHFAPDDAVRVLREMERLSRVGFIVNDVYRSVPGFVVAWLASRVATRNRLTRHDMPLSVRRAYTPEELRALCASAAIRDVCVTTHPFFRMAAVRRKAADLP